MRHLVSFGDQQARRRAECLREWISSGSGRTRLSAVRYTEIRPTSGNAAKCSTTGWAWCEAEVNRIAGAIALKSPKLDAAKAEAYFDRALEVARKQQAKSWELRAAMSMARLWRDQGKRDEACDLLAPVYGWFTEGFDTLDLKEAKALLRALAA
jgi:predicted ATPase